MESSFSPREIVSELDKFIIGQNKAKRAVAVALRNRWRRKQLDESLKEEIVPKNILMVGPTGCGKTEISRRLAKLANAPFVKVEATKFTEVGYVGRDVEQIIRDLVEISITKTKIEMGKEVKAKEELCVIESVKAASDIYSPLDGEVLEVNENLSNDASIVNQDAENEGWIFKLKVSDIDQVNNLMTLDQYKEFLDK